MFAINRSSTQPITHTQTTGKSCGLYFPEYTQGPATSHHLLAQLPLWASCIISCLALYSSLLPGSRFHPPPFQFLLNNSSQLSHFRADSNHAPPWLGGARGPPIALRIKARVLAMTSKAHLVRDPSPRLSPFPTSLLHSDLSPTWPAVLECIFFMGYIALCH